MSSRDRQGLADGKTGWLGIEAFGAMEQEGLRINRPYPGGPATKAGVTAGDLITELDDAPLKGLSLADVLARLRGPANTTIKMKIVHKGQDSASDLSVVRAARRVNAVQLQVRVEQGKLVAEATGAWPILEFEEGKATPLVATSSNEFTVDDEDHTRIAFVRDAAGKVSGLILNPGPWEQKAAMIAPGPK
ncbi:S41 family peptidase [Bradyrhizobium erythrophlei]|uniref:S41 family peptidase n=1 Tax=Bradyrhizobium erythrophlei TaxID=1437360 RepID=UPI001FCCDDBA|nr:PDZ domain-containing protein [Bradyrhizobium erythrophlei]